MAMFRSKCFIWTVLTTVGCATLLRAQTEVRGRTTIPVSQGVSGVNFLGTNKTGRDICDFEIEIKDACNVNINSVVVTSTQEGGAGDWDVDDDASAANIGSNNSNNDHNDIQEPPGMITRVDLRGDGRHTEGGKFEFAPQNVPGKCIEPDEQFFIYIYFQTAVEAGCNLIITPTDRFNFQLASLYVPNGVQQGPNVLLVYNETSFAPGLGVGTVNATGEAIEALRFETTGNYQLLEVSHIDMGEKTHSTVNCGGSNACVLQLAKRVQPNGFVGFDAKFNQLDPGEKTTLTVTSVAGIPTVSEWGLLAMTLLVLTAATVVIMRRRAAVA